MFSEDQNEFVIPEFKVEKRFEQYVDWQLNLAPYSPTHGAQDWLIKLEETEQYIGLLHLYELSLETFMKNHQRCYVGVAIKSDQRRKYLASEAIANLMDYTKEEMGRNIIVSRTEHENSASQDMLLTLGFEDATEKYWAEYRYFEKFI